MVFAFLLFLHAKDENVVTNTTRADGIVVFTGETRRIYEGLSLLSKGQAPIMHISGVEKSYGYTTLNTRYPRFKKWINCCLTFDNIALDTYGNAQQTALWIKDNNLKSVILLTSGYHMPRSKVLLKRATENIKILPSSMRITKYDQWWRSKQGIQVVLNEYIKYAVALLGLV